MGSLSHKLCRDETQGGVSFRASSPNKSLTSQGPEIEEDFGTLRELVASNSLEI